MGVLVDKPTWDETPTRRDWPGEPCTRRLGPCTLLAASRGRHLLEYRCPPRSLICLQWPWNWAPLPGSGCQPRRCPEALVPSSHGGATKLTSNVAAAQILDRQGDYGHGHVEDRDYRPWFSRENWRGSCSAEHGLHSR